MPDRLRATLAYRRLASGAQDRLSRARAGASRVERLERAIAINLVIAWRLMVLVLLGREVPELPAEIMFSDVEIRVLGAWATTIVSAKPPSTLGEAVLLVARLGGYPNRNNDPPPGYQVMWRGYQLLIGMCIGYQLRDP